jgi:dolichol-phosphate mannosyltransferase
MPKAEFMKRRIQDGTVPAAPSGLFCAYYRLRLALDGRAKSHQLSQPVAVSSSVNPVKLVLMPAAVRPWLKEFSPGAVPAGRRVFRNCALNSGRKLALLNRRAGGPIRRTGQNMLPHAFLAMNNTLVIVPTYNERENLPKMAECLAKLPVAVDMLVVDDNSPDGTGKIADELAAKNPAVHVLHRAEKDGLGRAYCAGFAWALQQKYEFIMEMDCDFSHNPDDIPLFLEAARDADLVLGSRYCGGIRVLNWPLKRLLLSTGAALYVQIITGMPFTDPTGGFKCFRRRALESINLDRVLSKGYSFQLELTHKIWQQGFKIVEVPIIFVERVQGHSKMSGKIFRESLLMVWRLWLQCGMRRSPKIKRNDGAAKLV